MVRKSNKQITAQVVESRLGGDHIMAAAYTSELPTFGVKQGLTNYSAAYCVGLLCARRLLTKIGLDTKYKGNTVVGKFFENQDDESRRSFRCFLDVGIQRTTTGANIFGALKGAVDGGLNIPYSGNRLAAGYFDKKANKYNEAALANRIYGVHVSDYMKQLAGDEAAYKTQFGTYIKNGVKPEALKDIYTKAHEAIRKAPVIKRELPTTNGKKVLTKEQRLAKRAD